MLDKQSKDAKHLHNQLLAIAEEVVPTGLSLSLSRACTCALSLSAQHHCVIPARSPQSAGLFGASEFAVPVCKKRLPGKDWAGVVWELPEKSSRNPICADLKGVSDGDTSEKKAANTKAREDKVLRSLGVERKV